MYHYATAASVLTPSISMIAGDDFRRELLTATSYAARVTCGGHWRDGR